MGESLTVRIKGIRGRLSIRKGCIQSYWPIKMGKTVIEHVLAKLKEHGVKDIFGVAGDFAFPIEDAVCADKQLRWVGCCNELNAAYAADGYARVHGFSVLSTTYGVGELSAMNAIAGSFAEFLPVFHIVGMPGEKTQRGGILVHHTLGNGEFDVFHKMADPIVCAKAIISVDNAVAETERLIRAALERRQPVYMGIPKDVANKSVNISVSFKAQEVETPRSDSATLTSALKAICDMVNESKSACVLPGVQLARFGLKKEATAFVEAANLPFATLVMDKAVLDESHPHYVGMYSGKLMNESVTAFVESCDCVISLGVRWSDMNTGYFTLNIDQSKKVEIMLRSVRVGSALYENIEMKDVLDALTQQIQPKKMRIPQTTKLPQAVGKPDGKITVDYLYPRWEQMLRPNDILVTETGSSGVGLAFASIPPGATFHNQTLWGSIGWATPASFGAALARPSQRTILVTGDGSHQLTVQEICQFHRFNLKPLIFVLNNDGYLIERMLCKHPEYSYNDIPRWNYHKIPEALGCDGWFCARVTTCGELDQAIAKAEAAGSAAYIEVVTDKYDVPAFFKRLGESPVLASEA